MFVTLGVPADNRVQFACFFSEPGKRSGCDSLLTKGFKKIGFLQSRENIYRIVSNLFFPESGKQAVWPAKDSFL